MRIARQFALLGENQANARVPVCDVLALDLIPPPKAPGTP
jgi:hypothetical protein